MTRPTFKAFAVALAASVSLTALAPAASAFNPQPEPPATNGLKQKAKRFDTGRKAIIVIENRQVKKPKRLHTGKIRFR